MRFQYPGGRRQIGPEFALPAREANPWRCLQGPERLPTPAGYPTPMPATETRVFPAEFQGSASDRGNTLVKKLAAPGGRRVVRAGITRAVWAGDGWFTFDGHPSG